MIFIRFNVSKICNRNCNYCHIRHTNWWNERNRSELIMKNETLNITLKKLYSFIDKNNIDYKLIVNFYGGEPLINYKLIRWFFNIHHNSLNNLVFTLINTNGTLLNKIDDIIDSKSRVHVSLDSFKEENYSESDKLTVKNISNSKHKENIRINTVQNIENLNNNFFEEVLYFLEKYSIKSIKIYFPITTSIKIPSHDIFDSSTNSLIDNIIKFRNYNKEIYGLWDRIFQNSISKIPDLNILVSIEIEPNGDMYSGFLPSEKIGNIYDLEFNSKIWNFLILESKILWRKRYSKIIETECKNCDIKNKCKSYPLLYNTYHLYDKFYYNSLFIECEFNRILSKKLNKLQNL